MGKTTTTAALTVAALALTLTACTPEGPKAEDAAALLAEGLTNGDVGAVTFTSVAAEEVNTQLDEITAALDPVTPAVTVASVESTGEDSATAQLNHVWDLDSSDSD